ncbi:Peptidase, M23/M37 family [Pseudoalteromonas luteoviolacea B = ATCC 29581]|nr:Peptidase, M23/M37 family [Pseudoalteromonas luteoviolacea B = ATCC 29581]
MHKSILFAAVTSLFSCSVSALELKGTMTQGAMIIGQVNNAEYVRFNGKHLELTKDGHFVFGFSRDEAANGTLEWRINGKNHSKTLIIEPRQYKIDRVNGVEQKYVSPPKSVLERIKNDSKLVAAARAKKSEHTYFLQPFLRPAEGRISGVYGSQRIFNGEPKNPHFGLDIANKTGTPVFAPNDGVVVLAEPDLYYSGGTVILDHGFGITSTYIHLSKLHVKVGEKLKRGTHFADIGATGRVTGPHLDWRLNWFNERLDPALIMQDSLAGKETKK